MPLIFKEEEKTFTFTWDEGGPEECAFTVRQPSPRDFTKIVDKNTKHVWDAPDGLNKRKREMAMKRFEKIDHEAFMDDKVDFLILSWNVEDADGKPLACNRENKIAFDKARPDVTGWLFDKLDEQAQGDKEAGDKEEKN